jgi:hypothetical protein
MGTYAPADAWPDHSKSWFNDLFKKARGHGWSLETHSNHGTYTLLCPAGVCRLLVYSTGKGGESVAKNFGKRIERCIHSAATTDALTRAIEKLDQAERLLNALDTIHERDHVDSRTQSMLFDPEGFDEDEVNELFLQVDRLTEEATALLDDDLKQADSGTIVDATGAILSEARGLLNPLSDKNPLVKEQKERLAALRARCEELRRISGHS